jgi:hypothetical protein
MPGMSQGARIGVFDACAASRALARFGQHAGFAPCTLIAHTRNRLQTPRWA